MNCAELIAHGQAELEQAAVVLANHRAVANGCCACGRGLPCREAATWDAYRRYWTARLDLLRQQTGGDVPAEVVR